MRRCIHCGVTGLVVAALGAVHRDRRCARWCKMPCVRVSEVESRKRQGLLLCKPCVVAWTWKLLSPATQRPNCLRLPMYGNIESKGIKNLKKSQPERMGGGARLPITCCVKQRQGSTAQDAIMKEALCSLAIPGRQRQQLAFTPRYFPPWRRGNPETTAA